MASVCCDKGGLKRVAFKGLDGKRRSLRLGKRSEKYANDVRRHVEAILASAGARLPMDQQTAVWLAEIESDLHSRLASVGLVTPREVKAIDSTSFGAWIDRFRESRAHLKGGTRMGIDYALDNAAAFFGRETAIASITPGRCDDFAIWLTKDQKQAPATAGRRIRTVKAVFRAAVRHELLIRNPMEGIKEGSQSNSTRQQFVDRETIERVIEACPDTEWRLLVCLARFGGLRIPSEAITLRWGDIDWARDRLTVHSPKTEHHPGKERRQIPLFPEIRSALDDRWEVADRGSEFIFDRMRRTVEQSETGWKAVNLRTQFGRILEKAGVTPWPRLWVNLRSSCETELTERFPAHVTAAWLGHTPDVAQKHYLQTLDSHFASAAQNATRTMPESTCKETTEKPQTQEISRIIEKACTKDYPAWIRTMTNRTKICCATVTLRGKNGASRVIDTRLTPDYARTMNKRRLTAGIASV